MVTNPHIGSSLDDFFEEMGMTVEVALEEERELPFFVYGTLLPGQHNHSVVQGFMESCQPADLTAAALWAGPGYPYMLTRDLYPNIDADSVVRGALVTIKPGLFDAAINRMDALEGISVANDRHGLYQRVVVQVQLVDIGELVDAYVYVAGTRALQQIHTGRMPKIESGNWVEFIEELRQLRNDTSRARD